MRHFILGALALVLLAGRAALDGQEGGGDVIPAGVPFDAAALCDPRA